MKEKVIRKIVFGNTVFDIYACNENDEFLITFFEANVAARLKRLEDVYNWLRRHDIYYKVHYNKSFRHPFGGYISSRLDFARFKRIFPVSNRALAKFHSDDELISEILSALADSDCTIRYYAGNRQHG